MGSTVRTICLHPHCFCNLYSEFQGNSCRGKQPKHSKLANISGSHFWLTLQPKVGVNGKWLCPIRVDFCCLTIICCGLLGTFSFSHFIKVQPTGKLLKLSLSCSSSVGRYCLSVFLRGRIDYSAQAACKLIN